LTVLGTNKKTNMTRQTLFILFLSGFALFSCKKEKIATSPKPQTGIPLSVGSEWEYAVYRVDTPGREEPAGTETVLAEKDTVIRGGHYTKMVHSGGVDGDYIRCLRDSSGYLISSEGNVLYSAVNFNDVISSYTEPGYYSAKGTMAYRDRKLTVPAGTFTTNTLLLECAMEPPYNQFGPFRYAQAAYAENVGLVSATNIYLSSPAMYETRLVKYTIR
jgi:hypothetical protein